MSDTKDIRDGFPIWVRELVQPALQPDESPLAWFEPDLNTELQYAQGLVVLTDRRVIGFEPEQQSPQQWVGRQPAKPWQSWPLDAETTLRAREHAGVGKLTS